MKAKKELFQVRAEAIAKKMNADVILYAGRMYPPGDTKMFSLVKKFRKRDNVLVFMTTGGGLPETAYKLGRCLQNNYTKISLFIDLFCKSAGTIFALGADEIIMSENAELG